MALSSYSGDLSLVTCTGIELNFSDFLTCRDMENTPYLRHFLALTVLLSCPLSYLFGTCKGQTKDNVMCILLLLSFQITEYILNTVKKHYRGNNHEQI